MDEVVRHASEREPTSAELAEYRRRWEMVGLSVIADALSSPTLTPLVDNPYIRPYAQAWLVDQRRRAKMCERRAAWGTGITLAMSIISAIAAIIAAVPVVQAVMSGHS
jgi:hypothetical protein